MSKNLAVLRRALGISQTDMAKVIGLGLTSYNLKENGKSDFNQEQMVKLRDFFIKQGFNVSIEELFFNKKVINPITE